MIAAPTFDCSKVQAWFDEASSVVPALDGTALDAAIVDSERIVRRAEALRSALIGQGRATGRFRTDGHRRLGGWVAALTDAGVHDAGVAARVAKALASMPTLRAAFETATVSFEVVEIITRRTTDDRLAERLLDDDAVLAEFAVGRSTDEIRRFMSGWDRIADPVGAHRDHVEAHRRRRIRIVRKGAEVSVHVRLGATDGEVFAAIHDRFAKEEFAADSAAAVHGELPRSADQRGADAFMAAMRTADRWRVHGQQPCPTCATPVTVPTGSKEPLVNLMLDAETIREWSAGERREGSATTVTDLERLRRFAAGTTDGDPIDVDDIVRSMILGQIRVVVRKANGAIERVGRRQRLFRGVLRDAVVLQHPTCIWPGCPVPASRCQADHLHPHGEGGPTEIDNGGPLCGYHNRYKAEHGYLVRRSPDGRWHVLRPDGTPISAHAPSDSATRFGIEIDHRQRGPGEPDPLAA